MNNLIDKITHKFDNKNHKIKDRQGKENIKDE